MRLRLLHLNQLKLLEKHLYSEYKKNMMFKRIYESNNKKSKTENKDIEEMIINNPELFSIIDSVSSELANYIMGKNDSAKELFEGSGRHLTIDNCFTLLRVIHEVINMLEDDLRTGRISLQ
jgi:predicted secreted protein